jgi:methylthioribose-1-phosphate isomerase
MNGAATPLRALWFDGELRFADQRELPGRLRLGSAADAAGVICAIESGALGGARCLDTAGAFAAAFARRSGFDGGDLNAIIARLESAVGASDAVEHGPPNGISRARAASPGTEIAAAQAVLDACARVDRSIAHHVAALLPSAGTVLTHGSTGALSSGGGEGTALGGILAASRGGRRLDVLITESRPRAGGQRLAAFECAAAGVTHAVIPDSAAAALMRARPIDAVIVGADTMEPDGDAVAVVGTYALALAAAHHRIPFYVALPRSAVAQRTTDGKPASVPRRATALEAASPDDDETPGRLITAVITEFGITRPPYDVSLAALATRPNFLFTRSR